MQTLLIVDDDESVRLALPEALSCAGREIIVCSDLESAQLVVERYAPACIVTDVRLSGPFRFEASISSPTSASGGVSSASSS